MVSYKADYALFLGREERGCISEFVGGELFFLTLEVQGSLSKEQARSILHNIGAEIDRTKPSTLSAFKDIIGGTFSTVETSSHDAFAGGLVVGDIIYLVTRGKGAILIQRDTNLSLLINGDTDASGHVKENDMLVFSSLNLLELIDVSLLKKHVGKKTPKEIVEELTPLLKEKDDKGLIALFVQFSRSVFYATEETTSEETLPVAPTRSIKEKVLSFLPSLSLSSHELSRRRRFTFVMVFILFAILVWSVVFGYQRRAHAMLMKRIQTAQEKIDSKLSEAKDLSTLNLDRSIELLTEAKTELTNLRHDVGDKKVTQISELEEKITQAEKHIIHKDEKGSEVFYELSLIEKDASARSMYLEEDELSLLNSSRGKIYALSLSKKSANTIQKNEFSDGIAIASYLGNIFVLKSDGVYKIDSEEKIEQIIKNDEWGHVIDIAVYNGNIYLLDPVKNEIYKYLVAEEGYSDKTTYLKSGGVNLQGATSLVIDSSLYITTGSKIHKFIGGVRDTFDLKPPSDQEFVFDSVFTDKESKDVYLLDKTHGKVVIAAKNGTYQKQIESSVFKNAADFIIIEKAGDPQKAGIFVLTGDKIYRVGL